MYAEDLDDELVMPNDFTETEIAPEELYLHTIQVSAPSNVGDDVKDGIFELSQRLTDDELAYAIVWIKDELEFRQNEEILDQQRDLERASQE